MESGVEFIHAVYILTIAVNLYLFAGGKVTSEFTDAYKDIQCAGTTIMKDVTLGSFLQATTGARYLARNQQKGQIMFDHDSKKLSSVNTCGPVINFNSTRMLVDYERFQSAMIDIILGSPGFGQC